MMKKFLITTVVGGVLVGLGYAVYRFMPFKKELPDPTARNLFKPPVEEKKKPPQSVIPTPNRSSKTDPIPKQEAKRGWMPDMLYPIKKGSAGGRVLLIQKMLNKMHKARVPEDAKFGTRTHGALAANGYPTVIDKFDFERFKAMIDKGGLAGYPQQSYPII